MKVFSNVYGIQKTILFWLNQMRNSISYISVDDDQTKQFEN